ncbi:ABC transporter, ATP-binding protein [Sphingobacterium spiritivorum ATCC 33300]|uniref:ABC transporter, ATP-binding protein n=1 Tax=Sphingobacterium spiritivorum ATCC 33300 TaxID=525372 RepID=C2G0E8_SPHSI|nr:ATP-binding cassette domain-containing protein [Sphingobacterium spiritivorum]EEI91328.1 ABC transporter, ATP-binding protein [Sphingobacterium spiritivorum ATCC 33300]QQS97431.1 ABC transporter ATP-binding protein [Sphingobacterium spiritivorum]
MKITLQDIGRRYNRDWIFRHIDYTFSVGHKYAVLGPNGSGKSTLLKVLCGNLTPSEGKIIYHHEETEVAVDRIFHHLSIAAPYIELIEDLTLHEMITFHFKFKNFQKGFDQDSLLDLLGLNASINKEIRYFSSGMKQRVKLALACCSDSALVFLDEPTSNLDEKGEAWYLELIEKTISDDRLLIVCSNQAKEYSFCDQHISISDYKNNI